MRHLRHSKSNLFLMELILNLLLFSLLCGCGLLFFIKSHKLSEETTTLQHATRIVSDIASIYESSNGDPACLYEIFSDGIFADDKVYLYYDTAYQPCEKNNAFCYAVIEQTNTNPGKIRIDFYNNSDTLFYSISACNHTPAVLQSSKKEDIS